MTKKTILPLPASQRPLPPSSLHPEPTSNPNRIPYKFLTRNLIFSKEADLSIKLVRVKRFYLKSYLHSSNKKKQENEMIPASSHNERFLKRLPTDKIFKTLKNININAVCSSYIQKRLKNSKSIKSLYIDSDHPWTMMSQIALLMKRLPAQIQNIHLNIHKIVTPLYNKLFYKIAKSLRRLPNLQSFHRWFTWDLKRNRRHVSKELQIYDNAVSRLPKINKTMYCFGPNEQSGFQKTMRRGQVFDNINGLRITLTSRELSDYDHLAEHIEGEDSLDMETEFYPTNMNPDEQEICKILLEDRIEEDKNHDNSKDIVRFLPQRGIAYPDDDEDSEDDEDEDEDEQEEVEREGEWCQGCGEFHYYDEEEDHDECNDYYDNEEGEDEEEDESDEDSVPNIVRNLDLNVESAQKEVDMRVLRAKFRMKEDIKPFYRFECFPNLKRLEIIQPDEMYPLGTFVIDGFAALKNLQELKISIENRSNGTTNIFRGFLQLPMLRKFSLKISSIKSNEWELLEKFLNNQRNLESLSLQISNYPSTRVHHIIQSDHLQCIILGFENKPLLKSLKLKSCFWSLRTLSMGLGCLSKMNQFESLKFEASDETIISAEKNSLKRIEGLCQFIKNQKDSLKKLQASISLVLDENVVVNIADAVSKLTQLRKFDLKLNSNNTYGVASLMRLFESNLQRDIPEKFKKRFSEVKTWDLGIARSIGKLENLEEFEFEFKVPPVSIVNVKQPLWFLDVMRALQGLRKLRKIAINSLSRAELRNMEKKICSLVLGLREIREIRIHLRNEYYMIDMAALFSTLNQIVSKVNERQSIRQDLMF